MALRMRRFTPSRELSSGRKGEFVLRIVVDLVRCQGYAQCCFLAPRAFKLAGEEALVYHPNPDDTQRQQILRAAAACPVQAIRMDPLETSQLAHETGSV
ncbi:hypothetical protein I547_5750 [Mycobacterium kansasii 824]|uniref:Ferredoxin n=2 Tax=Mycobacterium kansasii TaxID=1768 RepID=A0A1V3XCY5_MYCKA|nr:hypothetical protein I547_5750 [Mycobacterium kansasii 824]OOK76950.1 hypothetical protein BZL29_4008 [Mycobacterium kansasii]